MNKSLHIAFLGCGYATRLHSKTLSGFKPRVHCFYASRDRKKAESYSSQFNGAGAFGSYEAAIESDVIDAVFVATPPMNHLELTLAALDAGKHVIVEKPPFLNSTDLEMVRAKARQVGRRVFVAENYFYKPLACSLRELVKSEVIGEIIFVQVNAIKLQKVDDWRGDSRISGGGALFEGGIHWIDFVANLGLTPSRVSGFRPAPKEGLERSMLVSLEYEEGAVGTLYYSWDVPSLFKGLRMSKIYGREGSISFESNGLFIIVRGRKKRLFFPGLKDIAGYRAMFRDFITSIQMDREAEFNLELAARDLKLIECVYETAES